MPKKLTQEEVIKRFKEVHGNKYDYSKVLYKNTSTNVIIICLEHGEFLQKPREHLSKSGCQKCFKKNLKISKNKLLEQFKIVHNNKYDYSKVQYFRSDEKIEIVCPKHGSFWQLPWSHKKGAGCPICANIKNKGNLSNTLQYINKAKIIHNNKYDYSKTNYKHSMKNIEIICPKHGSFWQLPNNHLSLKTGCPKCAQESSESKGERKVREFLESNNIKYSQEVKLFDNYRFDFYLEDLNTVIEYDGKQHFEPVEYFGGLEGLKKTQERDKIKEDYCLKNDIRIIRIKYIDFNKIEKILSGTIYHNTSIIYP